MDTKKARRMIQAAREASATFDNKMFAEMYVHAIEQKVNHDNPYFLKFLEELEQPPVDITTFIDSDEFLGATDLTLWPEVRAAVIGINKDWWRGQNEANTEALLCGATGTGKSEIAKVTTAYHLHILGCMKNPQSIYGLPKATSIVFVIQAAKPHVTKKIIYMPLRNYIETMPWFQKHLRPHRLIEAEMHFTEKNIRVVPGGSDADTILGEALIGGVLDEVNFMNVVQNSKRADVQTGGRTGTYDQAKNIHDAVTRRKKSRFLFQGPQVGVVCVSSSTRYKGDFTDNRKKQIDEHNEKGVYLYEKAQYEVWPQDRYCGDKFQLVVENDASTDVRILGEGEKYKGTGNILDIPIEYKNDFLNDSAGALRDIVGKSVTSINPFFRQRNKVMDAVVLGKDNGLESFLVNDNVVLTFDGMPQVKRKHFCKNPSRPRYVHIDLSSTGDRCGIAMVRYDGMREMERANDMSEHLPTATVEMACTIKPDHNCEIDLAEVRNWVKQLKVIYGYPIKAVTYDGWNSLESRQEWKRQGMKTGHVSVDRTSVPYKHLREAVYDRRIDLLDQEVLIDEMLDLEFDEKKDKVDHPVKSSKDCADAVCGAFHTLLQRSSSWVMDAGAGRDDDGRHDPGDRHDGSEDRYG